MLPVLHLDLVQERIFDSSFLLQDTSCPLKFAERSPCRGSVPYSQQGKRGATLRWPSLFMSSSAWSALSY